MSAMSRCEGWAADGKTPSTAGIAANEMMMHQEALAFRDRGHEDPEIEQNEA